MSPPKDNCYEDFGEYPSRPFSEKYIIISHRNEIAVHAYLFIDFFYSVI